MKRVCIVEIKCGNHSVAELCKYANPKINEVILYTTVQLWTEISSDLGIYSSDIKVVLKGENERYYSFIKRINDFCISGVDLLVLNTISRWEFIFLKPNCPMLAYVYSLNFWSYDLYSYSSIIEKFFHFNYLNLLSWLPNRLHANPYFGFLIRRKLLSNINGLLVEYPPFVNQLEHSLNNRKSVYFLPKRTYVKIDSVQPKDRIIFVVTGMISEVRRDYNSVLNAFSKLPAEVQSKCKLVILGRPIKKYGCEVLDKLRELDKTDLELDYFDEFIPHDIFTQNLLLADYMISPIRLDYKSGVINERFTYTKGTGTFHDMLRYAIPTLVPGEYNVARGFENCFIRYQDQDDLASLIIKFANDKAEVRKQKVRTVDVVKEFSLTNAQLMFNELYDIKSAKQST